MCVCVCVCVYIYTYMYIYIYSRHQRLSATLYEGVPFYIYLQARIYLTHLMGLTTRRRRYTYKALTSIIPLASIYCLPLH